MDMTMSYKPVMLLALLEAIDAEGRAKLGEVVDGFQQFYQGRRAAGQVVERPGARQKPVDQLDEGEARQLMIGKPFETFERRRFLRYDRDLAYVRFDPRLWRQLRPEDMEQIRAECRRSIETYYERLQPE
jgi:hypothetical protein